MVSHVMSHETGLYIFLPTSLPLAPSLLPFPYLSSLFPLSLLSSNWAKIYARSYEPELVHDIIDSDQEQCYEDEDDSNGMHCNFLPPSPSPSPSLPPSLIFLSPPLLPSKLQMKATGEMTTLMKSAQTRTHR